MFATPAYAQATGAAASSGGVLGLLSNPQFGPIILMVGMVAFFWFLVIRPQQQRQKQHQAKIMAVKRGDTVVLHSGVIGKVVRVEDVEVGVEIAQGVTVKVNKAMLADVRIKGEPAPANDVKS